MKEIQKEAIVIIGIVGVVAIAGNIYMDRKSKKHKGVSDGLSGSRRRKPRKN